MKHHDPPPPPRHPAFAGHSHPDRSGATTRRLLLHQRSDQAGTEHTPHPAGRDDSEGAGGH